MRDTRGKVAAAILVAIWLGLVYVFWPSFFFGVRETGIFRTGSARVFIYARLGDGSFEWLELDDDSVPVIGNSADTWANPGEHTLRGKIDGQIYVKSVTVRDGDNYLDLP